MRIIEIVAKSKKFKYKHQNCEWAQKIAKVWQNIIFKYKNKNCEKQKKILINFCAKNIIVLATIKTRQTVVGSAFMP